MYCCLGSLYVFFFFQAEDGIRDGRVTGVQTCALPISIRRGRDRVVETLGGVRFYDDSIATAPDRGLAALRAFEEPLEIGRASCREREEVKVRGGSIQRNDEYNVPMTRGERGGQW